MISWLNKRLFRPELVYVVRDAIGFYIRDSRFVTAKEPWYASYNLFEARRCPSVNRAIKVGKLYGLDNYGFEIRRLRCFGLFTTLAYVVDQSGIHFKNGTNGNARN